ncbi:PHD finger protein 7-like [Dromaius novaehollandiae]|uniref:PHD finger protein 7-like n=1 Tax=Dromaius novaehollandiae TaxID=8790 RepID=UPI00311EB8F4
MLKMGIFVLFRPPAWEETGQYEELSERHSQCDAGQCLYQEGRQQAQESGPWELLLCCSCASRGTHRHCSAVGAAVEAWECDGCAGIGPAPSALPEPSAPSTDSKPGAEASSSPAAPASAEPDLASSSTSTTNQDESEASSSSATPASSESDLARSQASSQNECKASSGSATPATSELDLASSRAGSQEESESSPGSLAPESSPQAGQPGPERRPGRSRLFRRPQHPYRRP